MRRILILLYLTCILTTFTQGQILKEDYNYVCEYAALVPQLSDLSVLNDKLKVTETTNYMDGIGRLVQSVSRYSSISGSDIVMPKAYDPFGRMLYEYLPYVSSENNGLYKPEALNPTDYFLSEQYAFYANPPLGVAGSDYPFSKSVLESSPLNRPLEKGAPGGAWQPISTTDPNQLGFTTKMSYSMNDVDDQVIHWSTSASFIQNNGYYQPQTLIKTIHTDEQGNTSTEYTDRLGRVILKRIYLENETADTYYLYSDRDELMYVFPPALSALLSSSSVPTTNQLKDWAFQYTYDSRGRMIKKKVPGALTVLMVYDPLDRLVLTQDGNQRQTDSWLFTKYDSLNRPVATGLVEFPGQDLAAIESMISGMAFHFEERSSTGLFGYSNNTFPNESHSSSLHFLTFTYYDTYPGWSPNYDFQPISELSRVIGASENQPQGTYNFSNDNSHIKGQVTASKTRVLSSDWRNNDLWVNTVFYYDDRYRAIQTISINDFTQSSNRVSTLYNFTGWTLATVSTNEKTGQLKKEIRRKFNYDHQGRLLEGYHELLVNDVSQGEVLLAKNSYNLLGEMIEKNLHVEGGNAFQSIDYRYNIRGWLTSINQTSLIEDLNINPNDLMEDYFGMDLFYNVPVPGLPNQN